jgi:predicted AAA+ superfamily ATPase
MIVKLHDIKKTKKLDSNKKNNLYILVGPPCSGKSTWIENHDKKFIVINRDSCVLEIGEKYSKNNYDDAFDLMHKNKEIKKEIDLIIEENGKLYPIEIKKSSNPKKNAGRHFSVLEKVGLECGVGNVISMVDDLIPINSESWAVPVWLI